MPAIPRRENEERQKAVLNFFLADPTATGDEALRALVSGRLLPHGTKDKKGRQKTMGQKRIFGLKKKAEAIRRGGEKPPPASVRLPPPPGGPVSIATVRSRALEIQQALAGLPGDVVEIIITRDGLKMKRLEPREEDL